MSLRTLTMPFGQRDDLINHTVHTPPTPSRFISFMAIASVLTIYEGHIIKTNVSVAIVFTAPTTNTRRWPACYSCAMHRSTLSSCGVHIRSIIPSSVIIYGTPASTGSVCEPSAGSNAMGNEASSFNWGHTLKSGPSTAALYDPIVHIVSISGDSAASGSATHVVSSAGTIIFVFAAHTGKTGARGRDPKPYNCYVIGGMSVLSAPVSCNRSSAIPAACEFTGAGASTGSIRCITVSACIGCDLITSHLYVSFASRGA